MRFWRISNHADLSGRGGLVADGRWHRIGTPVVYATDHPATAMLETLAHLNVERVPAEYQVIGIEAPDGAPVHHVQLSDLPSGWRGNLDVTQALGTDLLKRAEHLIVLVPTVLVPVAWNALLNPEHIEAGECTIAEIIKGVFDPRLIPFPPSLL